MDEVEKSTAPVRHGFPNPKLGRMLDLMTKMPQFTRLSARVREISRHTSDFASLRAACIQDGIKQDLLQLVKQNRDIPDELPVLGAAPPTTALYGMVGRGVAVVDVGSGNCMKIKRYTGELKITAVDPNLSNEGHVVKQFKGTLAEYSKNNANDNVYTSWMAVPQLSQEEVDLLQSSDGLHMVPDHDLLLDQGVAVKQELKVKVSTLGGHYYDNYIKWPGYAISPGYLLCPMFKKRKFVYHLDTQQKGPYVPQCDATPAGFYDLDFTDVTPKFDGVFRELENMPSGTTLTGRNGDYLSGPSQFSEHFCLHLEELDEVFVLLRIVQYRGYVPPHCGSTLRHFCEDVKIKINGKPVLPPPPWQQTGLASKVSLVWEDGDTTMFFDAPTDGLISRKDGADHYCKHMWTVDLLQADVPAVRAALNHEGYTLRIMGTWEEGINELTMLRDGPQVTMNIVKTRKDKHTRTSVDTVVYLLDRPTLAEQAAIGEYNIKA